MVGKTDALKRSGDRDGADMRRLIQLMSQQIDYTLEDLGTICENHEIFERFSTLKEGKSPSAYRSAFGKFLNGYNQRMFTEGTTFQIVGTPKNRKYRIISSAER